MGLCCPRLRYIGSHRFRSMPHNGMKSGQQHEFTGTGTGSGTGAGTGRYLCSSTPEQEKRSCNCLTCSTLPHPVLHQAHTLSNLIGRFLLFLTPNAADDNEVEQHAWIYLGSCLQQALFSSCEAKATLLWVPVVGKKEKERAHSVSCLTLKRTPFNLQRKCNPFAKQSALKTQMMPDGYPFVSGA